MQLKCYESNGKSYSTINSMPHGKEQERKQPQQMTELELKPAGLKGGDGDRYLSTGML
jgi:hypothetical protein